MITKAKPWPVPEGPDVPANSSVWFRGIKNFDGILDFAMAHGMGDATELVSAFGVPLVRYVCWFLYYIYIYIYIHPRSRSRGDELPVRFMLT